LIVERTIGCRFSESQAHVRVLVKQGMYARPSGVGSQGRRFLRVSARGMNGVYWPFIPARMLFLEASRRYRPERQEAMPGVQDRSNKAS
jgi:hypothetical protein